MALSLILELKSNLNVLVTNSETKEQREVTLSFIQTVTKSYLSMLCQYKYYELIIEAEKYWNKLKRFNPEREAEVIRKIELEDEEIKNNIRRNVIQQEREKTAAKQQYWNEIAAYNKIQRQWTNDGYKIILKCKKSYNNALIALYYADYCLENDYRYNAKEKNIKPDVTIQVDLKNKPQEEQNDYKVLTIIMKEQEQKIIALQKENQALRKRIAELTR